MRFAYFPLAFVINIYYNTFDIIKDMPNFCHAAYGSCAAERREPCQAGNRAALSGMPVRHSPPARRMTEIGLIYVLLTFLKMGVS